MDQKNLTGKKDSRRAALLRGAGSAFDLGATRTRSLRSIASRDAATALNRDGKTIGRDFYRAFQRMATDERLQDSKR